MVLTNATYGLDPEAPAPMLIAAASDDRPSGARAGADPSSPAAEPGRSLVLGQRALRSYGGDRIGASRVVAGPGDEWRLGRPTAMARTADVNGYWAGEQLRVHRDPDGTPRHLEVVTFVLPGQPYDPKAPIPGGA